MATKDQQIKDVVEGLALGVLAQGIEALRGKLQIEIGFTRAWYDWEQAPAFPSLAGPDSGSLFWIGLLKSEGRRSVSAAWRTGQWVEPYVRYEGWTIDECLELHADQRVSAQAWRELGRLYVATFKPADRRHASAEP